MNDEDGLRVFDERVSARVEASFGALPPEARPQMYTLACAGSYADMRSWIDEQVALLSERASMVARLRDERSFDAALAELAAAHALRGCGVEVDVEPTLAWFGRARTPDFAVRGTRAEIAWIGDVWTRTVPVESVRTQRRWAELSRALARIPIDRQVAVIDDPLPASGQSPAAAPGASVRMQVVRALHAWLASEPAPGATQVCAGVRFRAFGASETGHVQMAPVTGYTVLGRKHLVAAIESKVGRYGPLAQEMAVPLMVVLAGAAETGVSAELVAGVLNGANTITFSFGWNTLGPIDSGPIEIRQTGAPPGFLPALSAVALLEVNRGSDAALTVWPVPDAARPLPPLSAPSLTWRAR